MELRKILFAVLAGFGGSLVLFWLPTFALGAFDEHTAMWLLLLVYCPFIFAPFICLATWFLHPETGEQRLWMPVLITTSFILPSSVALAWRDTQVHYSEFWKTFFFLVLLLGGELLFISILVSHHFTRPRSKHGHS